MNVRTAHYSDIRSRNRPSFYAAPLAFAVTNFTRALIEEEGGIDGGDTGLIVVSDECTLAILRELSRTAAQGSVSPLRFAGVSPSMLAGLPAIEQGIRGPTLCLTMPPAGAAGAILALIECWLGQGDIMSVIAIAHCGEGKTSHSFKGLIARSVGSELRHAILRLCN